MAKKKGSGEMDDDYEFDDLGDLDEGLDLGDMEDIGDDRNPSKTEIAKELSKEAGKGFLDGLVRETARKSLPAEYDTYSTDVLDYANLGSEMFNSTKSRVEKSMFKLGNEVKKILPFQSKILNNFLDKYKEENTRAQEASEEAMRDAGIQSNLSSIFDKQLEVQTAIEARREAKDQVKEKHSLVTTKLQSNLLSSIDSNTAQQTAFTLQISKEFYRRSLELQFKTYFVQADMLKTMKDYYKGFSVQFDNIVKNTGLPDFVKLTNTERLTEMVRDKTAEGIYKRLFSNTSYIQQVKEKALGYVNTKVDEKLQGIDTISDQLEMMNSAGEGMGGAGRILASVFSGMGGSVLGEKLASKISPKLKERIKDNKFINAGADQLAMLGSSPTTFFANLHRKLGKKQEEYEGENTPGQWLGNKVLGGLNDFLSVTNPDTPNFTVKKSSLLDHGKPAIYTNKTDRAITEQIPMYLARILQQNTDLTAMYKTVNQGRLVKFQGSEELVFNYEERKLTSKKEYQDYVQTNILAKKNKAENIKSAAAVMLKTSRSNLEKDKSANKDEINALKSKDVDKILADYFVKANNAKVTMDYKTLVEDALDEKKAPVELKELIARDPKLKATLKAINKGADKTVTDYVDRRFDDLDQEYPVSAIIELFKQTSRIAGAKEANTITKKVATVISKALTIWQRESKSDFLPEDMISGNAFKYLEKKEITPELKRYLGIFTNDLKRIINQGDVSANNAVLKLIGVVNSNIREAVDIDPSVFQTLFDLDSSLGQTGNLTNENLYERKLLRSSKSDIEYADVSDLRSITRVTKKQLEQDRADVFASIMDSKIVKGVTDFKKEINEAGGNPIKILKTTIKYSKKASDAIVAKSKEQYNKASDALTEVNAAFKKLTDEKSKDAIVLLTNKLGEYANAIDGVIAADTKAMDDQITTLNELKANITDAMSGDEPIKKIDREIKLTTAYYKDKIKVLTEIKSTLTNQHQRLVQVQQNMEGKSVTDVVTEVKNVISGNLEKLKELMKKAKAAEEKAEEAAA